MHKQGNFEAIAIVGLGAIYPNAKDKSEFWRNIVLGIDSIIDTPPSHWLINDYYDPNPQAIDKTYCKRGGFLPNIDFDPLEYGIPPSNIPVIDTSQLLALIVAKQVLQDTTGLQYLNMDLSRVSVILGSAALEALQNAVGRMQRPVWVKALREGGLPETQVQRICDSIANSYVGWQENNFPGLLGNVIAGRIANRFNLGGTNCCVDAACAGSLAAMHSAIHELQLFEADMVITGGVDTLNDIVMYMCFAKTKALSLTNDCRPFSIEADGTVLGEGIGMFAFKRLADAEKNQDKIYAVIKGMGTSSDGRSKSIYAPVAKGQSKAIQRAYSAANFPPTTIGLIEAHGTGTRAGDVAEFEGLQLGFATDKTVHEPYCALGSIKSQIGHTKSAAGAAGLFKAIMSLRHKTLPPTIKVDQPNPAMDFTHSPFYLNTECRPWVRNKNFPRRAGVSSFGFGGSNYHLALEEYCGPNQTLRIRTNPTELIVVMAETTAALIKTCQEMSANIENTSLQQIAKTSQTKYDPQCLARLAIVASDLQDLQQKLLLTIQQLQTNNTPPLLLAKGVYFAWAKDPGRVAFLFPGQGSQYINMGADLAMTQDSLMALWDNAVACMHENNGKNLADVVFPKPVFSAEEREQHQALLTQTQWSQPALAVTNLLYLSLLEQLGIRADMFAGHSFGELVALYAAGAMNVKALFTLAQKRGELMQQAGNQEASGMLMVAHPVQATLDILKNEKFNVTPANFNSPSQLILSGSLVELEKVSAYLEQKKISCKKLPVSSAFHSPLMQSASIEFKNFLNTITFNTPTAPVYANTTAASYPANADAIPNMLAEQLVKPVYFYESLMAMYQKGVRTFIEVGPCNILTNLVNASLPPDKINVIALDIKNESSITSLWHALGKLVVNGLNPNFTSMWREEVEPAIEHKPAAHIVKINGTNYGKIYPPQGGEQALPPPNPELPVIQQQSIETNTSPLKGHSMSQYDNSFSELQRQLFEAHTTYQKLMADTQISFMQTIAQLAQNGNTAVTIPSAPAIPVSVTTSPAPKAATIMPTPQVQQRAPMPAPVPAPIATPVELTVKPIPATPAAITITPAAMSATANDVKEILLDVVIEKTGYPRTMLTMDMSIEADLGIDSIKRVEILSALAEKIPSMPTISAADLGQIQTLGDILAYAERTQNKNLERAG